MISLCVLLLAATIIGAVLLIVSGIITIAWPVLILAIADFITVVILINLFRKKK